jgi:hypothetical protein
MKSFRSTAAFGAAALVILTSGAAFASAPSAPSSGAHARPAAASARAHHRVSHARTHRVVTPAKKK